MAITLCKSCKNHCKWGYEYDCVNYTPNDEGVMTTEEWLHTLNTEQLAEAILQQWIHGAYHGVGEFGLTDKEIELSRKDIVEWLKQPHKE